MWATVADIQFLHQTQFFILFDILLYFILFFSFEVQGSQYNLDLTKEREFAIHNFFVYREWQMEIWITFGEKRGQLNILDINQGLDIITVI